MAEIHGGVMAAQVIGSTRLWWWETIITQSRIARIVQNVP